MASVIMRRIGNDERSAVLLIYPLVATFVVMAAVMPFVYEPMPIRDLGLLGLIAVLAHLAMRLMIRAYQLGEAAIVAPMQYSQILWATAFGFLFFGETPDQATAIGAVVIISSGLYIVFRESRPGQSRNRPVLQTRSPRRVRYDPAHQRTSASARDARHHAIRPTCQVRPNQVIRPTRSECSSAW